MITVVPVLLNVGRSMREAFFMFWVTLWPLVLGFGLSGAVQTFVSRDSMRRQLGDHRPPAVARATVLGMLSSSCSYAASAVARAGVAKGADFVSMNVFMFASTNLVVELGIVLVVLMGWQFIVSEFVGGVIMIVLLTLLGGLYWRGRVLMAAQDRVAAQSGGREMAGGEMASGRLGGAEPLGWRRRLRSKSGWADASTNAVADLTMLRKELLIGYTVAGFLTVLVPTHVWQALFFHGHGAWTSVENAVVGPFVALISCVCSVGNVPLAAALWRGGISFGGVVSFLFADLIALPLLLIYRRYYGTRMMLRMVLVFWVVMSAAGLVTGALFRVSSLIPRVHGGAIVSDHFAWNYTSYLNLVFLGVFGVGYWAYRNRRRWVGADGGRFALDPVCGMQVEKAFAPAVGSTAGVPVYFCSEGCLRRFEGGGGSGGAAGSEVVSRVGINSG